MPGRDAMANFGHPEVRVKVTPLFIVVMASIYTTTRGAPKRDVNDGL